MSYIYLATTSSNRDDERSWVAVKIANVYSEHHQFHRATLDNEIEHLRRLKHPGIVTIHRIQGHTLPPNPVYSAQTMLDGRPWFSVMEYLSGGSLADLLRKSKQLDPSLALRIVYQLSQTLLYTHEQGVVHLDLKPENIVFRQPLSAEEIDPVLIDFGIARGQGQVGLEAGTLQWSPPERIVYSERQNLPPETMARPHPTMDVYAVGLLLYRMVTGRMPFSGSRKSITSAILRGEAAPPSSHIETLSPDLDHLILAAIAREPGDRPTIEEVGARASELLQRPEHRELVVPVAARRDIHRPEGEGLKTSRPFWLVPLLAVALLGMVGFLLFSQFNGDADAITAATVTAAGAGAVPAVGATSSATSTPRRATATSDASAGSGNRATATASATPLATSTPVPTHTPTVVTATATAVAVPAAPVAPTPLPTIFLSPTTIPAATWTPIPAVPTAVPSTSTPTRTAIPTSPPPTTVPPTSVPPPPPTVPPPPPPPPPPPTSVPPMATVPDTRPTPTKQPNAEETPMPLGDPTTGQLAQSASS